MENEKEIAPASAEETTQETGAEVAESPTAETSTTETPANGADKPAPQTQVEEPWHKSERFRKLTEGRRQDREQLQQLNEKYNRLLEQMATQPRVFQPQTGPQLDPQVLKEAQQLLDILTQVPGAKEKLGIPDIESLRKEVSQAQADRAQELFSQDFDKALDAYSTQYGLDKDELQEEVLDFIKENAYFDKSYQKGMMDMAFRHVLFPKLGELQERKVNLNLIKEKQTKKGLATEQPAKGTPSTAKKVPNKLGDHLQELINAGGGEVSFD